MRKVAIVVAVVVVVLCGGLGWIAYQAVDLGREIIEAGVSRDEFAVQRVGTPEAEVRAALPEPLSDIKDHELYGDDPDKLGMPAGASCVYYTITPFEAEGPDLWRFCFVDGALAEKSAITIPQ
ncbi:hypothetical protein O7623_06610 [Solwaraspora sp. WMMD791]|uniref:hypothetical protein n=1 Tax=Solwaraspora sp. WMMD791 TaxID=3016086 RepID=UPI00249BDFE5|nr:hypothetical protein [Solwaraspora sp. WMMD791]WFE28855.1 hypothetical protein O7623_06610 [Solwaraspora sp. WMMD791]